MMIFTQFLRSSALTPARQAAQNFLNLGAVADKIVSLAQRSGIAVQRLDQLAAPLDALPELIACPAEFDLPDVQLQGRVNYLGPSLYLPEKAAEWPFPEVCDKRIEPCAGC